MHHASVWVFGSAGAVEGGLIMPAHACTWLHMAAHACTWLHMPAHACTWLHMPAHGCTAQRGLAQCNNGGLDIPVSVS